MNSTQKVQPLNTNLSYGPDTAARIIGIGRTKIFALLRSGELPSLTIGGRRLVRHVDLNDFLEQQMQKPGSKLSNSGNSTSAKSVSAT